MACVRSWSSPSCPYGALLAIKIGRTVAAYQSARRRRSVRAGARRRQAGCGSGGSRDAFESLGGTRCARTALRAEVASRLKPALRQKNACSALLMRAGARPLVPGSPSATGNGGRQSPQGRAHDARTFAVSARTRVGSRERRQAEATPSPPNPPLEGEGSNTTSATRCRGRAGSGRPPRARPRSRASRCRRSSSRCR